MPVYSDATSKQGRCKALRFLCTTCRKRGEEVLIRIQTNFVPNFTPGVNFSTTYDALNPGITESLIDFEVTWNAKMTQDQAKITDKMVKDVPSTTDVMCSPGKYTDTTWKHDNIYQGFGPTFKGNPNLPAEAVGIAVDGTLLVHSLTAKGQDPRHPADGTSPERMDVCGGQVEDYFTYGQLNGQQKTRFLVFKQLPGCLLSDIIDEKYRETECLTTCKEDPEKYLRTTYEFIYKGLQIIGIALDGHVIYGPYNADHELWTCDDHDICNGRFFPDMDNSYAYVVTQTHPYTVGCWGPGPNQSYS